MLEKGYVNKDLLDKTELSSLTLTRITKGQGTRAKTANKLADALGLPVTELFS